MFDILKIHLHTNMLMASETNARKYLITSIYTTIRRFSENLTRRIKMKYYETYSSSKRTLILDPLLNLNIQWIFQYELLITKWNLCEKKVSYKFVYVHEKIRFCFINHHGYCFFPRRYVIKKESSIVFKLF